MKRFVIAVFIFAFVALCLSSCVDPATVHSTGLYDVYYIVDSNVLVGDDLVTHKIDRIYELDKDDYGRRFFKYVTLSRFLGGRTDIYVIIQQTDPQVLGYYQDICYLAVLREDGSPSEDEIGELKRLNDWGMPLVPERMTYIPNESLERIISDGELTDAVRNYLGLSEEIQILRNDMEHCGEGRQLYAVRALDKDEDGRILTDSTYLIVVNLAIEGYIEVCEEFDIGEDYQFILSQFREKYLIQQ